MVLVAFHQLTEPAQKIFIEIVKGKTTLAELREVNCNYAPHVHELLHTGYVEFKKENGLVVEIVPTGPGAASIQ